MGETNMLYDEDFIRNLPQANGRWKTPLVVHVASENKVQYSNIRTLILKWYDRVRDDRKADYASRLRSLNDKEFMSQMMEFCVAELCECFGEVEFDPVLDDGRTPDLLWKIGDTRVLIDVVTLFESREDGADQQALEELISYLEKTSHYFDFMLFYDFIDRKAMKPKTVKQELMRYFDSLDPCFVGVDECCYVETDGFAGTLFPRSKGVKSQVSRLGLMGPAMTVEPLKAIRERIREKLKKYGNWEGPVVVAVCKGTDFGVDWDDVASVLYGAINVQMNRSSGECQEFLGEGGLVMPYKGHAPNNRTLSGVLHCALGWSSDHLQINGLFLENPHAKHPLDIGLPTYHPVIIRDRFVRFQWINNKGVELGHH